jgi:transposase
MLKIELSEADVKALRYERYPHPHPRVQRKMEAVYLKSERLPYQRCRRVLEHAASLGIELPFLPLYSPNLNLIERLWKIVKKHCLYSKYYEKFEPFKQAVSDCLALTSTKYKNELKSLLTLNFQTFEKGQIVTV